MAKFLVEIGAPAAILLYPILRKTSSSQHPAASSDSPAVFCGCPTFPIVGRIPPGFYLHIYKEPAYSAADVAGDRTGSDTDRLIKRILFPPFSEKFEGSKFQKPEAGRGSGE